MAKHFRIRALCVILCALWVAGCNLRNLRRTGDAMVRVERAAEELVLEVDDFGASEEERCRDLGLETKAERAECVATALKVVEGSEVAIQALKAALETFWRLYPEIEAKLEAGEKVGAEDLAVLFQIADQVRAEYAKLVPLVQELRGPDQASLELELLLGEAEIAIVCAGEVQAG